MIRAATARPRRRIGSGLHTVSRHVSVALLSALLLLTVPPATAEAPSPRTGPTAAPSPPPAPRSVPSTAHGRPGGAADGRWEPAGPAGVSAPLALAVASDDADRVYLATAEGVYQSRDGGRTWAVTALPGLVGFALHPVLPSRMYAVTADDRGHLRLWRSDNRGESWRPGAALEAGDERRRVHFQDLALDRRRPDRLFLAGVSVVDAEDVAGDETAASAPRGWVWTSDDGGESSRRRPFDAGDATPPHLPTRLAAGAGGHLYAATRAGVFRGTDGGASWTPARRGLEESRGSGFRAVSHLLAGPGEPDHLLAVAEPASRPGASARLFRSRDGGASWWPEAADVPAGPVTALAADPGDRRALWLAVAGAGLFATRSATHGGPWAPVLPATPGEADLLRLAVGPDQPRTLWAATAGGELFRRSPPAPECADSPTSLCLGGRFRVEADQPAPVGPPRAAAAVPLTRDGGWFWFDDPERPDIAVRLTPEPERAEGEPAGRGGWRVYATSLTEVPFDLRVLDVESGRFASLGSASTDPDAASETLVARFPASGSAGGDDDLWFAALPEGGCGGESIDLCLHGARFEVTVDWWLPDPATGETATGAAVGDRLGDEAGWFRFLHPGEPELFVKVLDGRDLHGHWEVTFGSLTDLGFSLTVTDRLTGEAVAYEVAPGGPAYHHDPGAFAASER